MEPILHRPDYPPKTPPPPKRPISPERPDPDTKPAGAVATRRPAAVIRNRRAANWALENAPWSPPKAATRVVEQLADWGFVLGAGQRETVAAVTRALAVASLKDGGKRVTVHVAEEHRQALVLVLSHQDGPAPDADQGFLDTIVALGDVVVECGADTDRDEAGNRRWALLDLAAKG
ncbi:MULTISPECIES: hypothetical protein [unclassified Streptomyces]|uniref:hypothetical protein n=1 Tax=unclassified Streptomyces TaxID=2593676 RepID=UPI0034118578